MKYQGAAKPVRVRSEADPMAVAVLFFLGIVILVVIVGAGAWSLIKMGFQ